MTVSSKELMDEMRHEMSDLSLIRGCDCIDTVELLEDKLLCGVGTNADEYNKDHLLYKTVNGMHSRMLFIEAGDFITGRIHSEDYIDILVSGKVLSMGFLEDGTVDSEKEEVGPMFMEGKAGRKRVLHAITDCLWVTVDRTHHEKIEDIQESVTSLKMDEYRKKNNIMELSR